MLSIFIATAEYVFMLTGFQERHKEPPTAAGRSVPRRAGHSVKRSIASIESLRLYRYQSQQDG